jgi:hypothetical protein
MYRYDNARARDGKVRGDINKLLSSRLFEGVTSVDTVNVVRVSFIGNRASQRASSASGSDRVRTAANALRRREFLDTVLGLAGERAFGHRSLCAVVFHFLLFRRRCSDLFLELAHERIGLSGELATGADRGTVLVE